MNRQTTHSACPIGFDACEHKVGCPNIYNGNVTSFGGVDGCWYAHGDYAFYDCMTNVSLRAMLYLLDEFERDERVQSVPLVLGQSVAMQLGIDADESALVWMGYQVYNQFERCFEYGSSPRFAWLDYGLTPTMLRALIEPNIRDDEDE